MPAAVQIGAGILLPSRQFFEGLVWRPIIGNLGPLRI